MSVCSKHHLKLDELGFGRCSVPMWCMGLPAGFCDQIAYGEPTASTIGLYVPGLACPGHGGPNTRIYRDGTAWCAVYPDFTNLQESPAGFGDTPETARVSLNEQRAQAAERGEP